jgi:hypothetical protein
MTVAALVLGGAFLPLCITFRPARCGRNGEMATGVLLG